MEVNYQSPIKSTVNQVSRMMEDLDPEDKHWYISGKRGFAVAIKLLQDGKIIAVPTDTIYGFAGLAQSKKSVEKLYALKGRDKSKPLAICVSSVTDIHLWGETDHIPNNLITALLPGPVTIVLKRKPNLKEFFNPDHDSVGIRVPTCKFIRSLARILNEPLALTSANSSNSPSSLTAEEFSHLWPKLGGIFYNSPNKKMLEESNRVGSTIVDLVIPNTFKIIRRGIDADRTLRFLKQYGLQERDS